MVVNGGKIHRDRFRWKNPDWKFMDKIHAIWMRYTSAGLYYEYEIEGTTESGEKKREFLRIVAPDLLSQLKKFLIQMEPCGAIRNAITLGSIKLADKPASKDFVSSSLIPKELMEFESKDVLILTTLDEWKKYNKDKSQLE